MLSNATGPADWPTEPTVQSFTTNKLTEPGCPNMRWAAAPPKTTSRLTQGPPETTTRPELTQRKPTAHPAHPSQAQPELSLQTSWTKNSEGIERKSKAYNLLIT